MCKGIISGDSAGCSQKHTQEGCRITWLYGAGEKGASPGKCYSCVLAYAG